MPDIQLNIKVAMQGATGAFSSLSANVITLNQALGLAQTALRGVSQAYDQVITSTVDYGSQVKNLSRVIGASAEESSKLISAADDVGVSFESISTAMKGAIQRGYQPTIQGLGQIADAYNQIQDPIAKSKYLLDTFGRSGLEMAALLERGSAGIRALGDEAEKMGLVFTPQDLQNIKEYKKAVDDLADAWQGFTVSAGNAALPTITEGLNYSTGAIDYYRSQVQKLGVGGALMRGNLDYTQFQNEQRGPGPWATGYNLPKYSGEGAGPWAAGYQFAATPPIANYGPLTAPAYNGPLPDKIGAAEDRKMAAWQGEKTKASAAAAASGGMNSSISDAYKAQNDLMMKQLELMDQLKRAEKAGSYSRVNDAKKALAENGKAQSELGESIKKTTAEFITQQSIQGVTTNNQIAAARATGEFSEYEYKLASAIEQAKKQYAGADSNGQAYGEAIAKIQEASVKAGGDTNALTKELEALEALPDIQQNITVVHTDIYRTIVEGASGNSDYAPGSASSGNYSNPYQPYTQPGWTPKAAGGPVASGNTFLVGEKGPELFTPATNGSIIPNNMISTVQPSSGGGVMIGGIYITGSGNARATAEMTVKLLGRYVRDSRRAGGANVG